MDLFLNNSSTSNLRLLLCPLGIVLGSFYFFPFEFSFAIGANTKMIMAGCGLLLVCFQMAKRHGAGIRKDLLQVFLWAGVVSVCALISVFCNGTSDFAYVTYIISMAVWLSAANVCVSFIRYIHGYVSVSLVCYYLAAICVLQCILALIIDNYEPFRNIVNTYIATVASTVSSGNSLTEAGRLYGIGAALDIAGSRFSAVLVMLSVLAFKYLKDKRKATILLIGFFIILVVGSFISRTTMVGAVLGGLSLLLLFIRSSENKLRTVRYILFYTIAILICVIPVITYLYNTNQNFHDGFRFAFEGFFNYFEYGVWRTNSTDTLKAMYVFPDTIKTWILGDGYFADPIRSDPYYIGESLSAFYKGVDVGYLRFIYYFGVIGLSAFVIYFCKVAGTCKNRFPACGLMFQFILAVNFIVWLKVSTDIFLVFALFLCIGEEENDECEKRYLMDDSQEQ